MVGSNCPTRTFVTSPRATGTSPAGIPNCAPGTSTTIQLGWTSRTWYRTGPDATIAT